MIRVDCLLTDCRYYNKPADPSVPDGRCDCEHPEKELYLGNEMCPLYRQDWTKLNPEGLKSHLADKKKTAKKKKKRLI